jgi:hypothetical protein
MILGTAGIKHPAEGTATIAHAGVRWLTVSPDPIKHVLLIHFLFELGDPKKQLVSFEVSDEDGGLIQPKKPFVATPGWGVPGDMIVVYEPKCVLARPGIAVFRILAKLKPRGKVRVLAEWTVKVLDPEEAKHEQDKRERRVSSRSSD